MSRGPYNERMVPYAILKYRNEVTAKQARSRAGTKYQCNQSSSCDTRVDTLAQSMKCNEMFRFVFIQKKIIAPKIVLKILIIELIN